MASFKKNFKFPLEDDGYKGKISFEAIKESYKTLPQTVFDGLVDATSTSETVTPGGPAGGAGIRSLQITRTKRLREIENLRGRQKTVTSNLPPRIATGRKATLYLPQTLQFQDNIEYTNVDLGIVGSAAAKALGDPAATGRSVLGAIGNNLTPDFASIQEAFNIGLRSEAAQVSALRLASKLSPEVQGAIETTTGISLNPNRRSTLRGIGIRQFRFTFKMIPTSLDEANEIKQIVQFFREEMYPDTSNEGLDAALRFPSKFIIKMFYDNKKVATNILPSFLAGVDVVYNSSGMSFHSSGDFQETDISLNFVEERALTKRDVIKDADNLGVNYSLANATTLPPTSVLGSGAR